VTSATDTAADGAAARVCAYLNTSTDGRPTGMLDGYAPGHQLALAFEMTVPAAVCDVEACEQVFFLLNVGDDPAFGTPDPRALEYRLKGHRSFSVGDIVTIDDRAYACAGFGFTPIPMPSTVEGQR
jgi:hypothetical protein